MDIPLILVCCNGEYETVALRLDRDDCSSGDVVARLRIRQLLDGDAMGMGDRTFVVVVDDMHFTGKATAMHLRSHCVRYTNGDRYDRMVDVVRLSRCATWRAQGMDTPQWARLCDTPIPSGSRDHNLILTGLENRIRIVAKLLEDEVIPVARMVSEYTGCSIYDSLSRRNVRIFDALVSTRKIGASLKQERLAGKQRLLLGDGDDDDDDDDDNNGGLIFCNYRGVLSRDNSKAVVCVLDFTAHYPTVASLPVIAKNRPALSAMMSNLLEIRHHAENKVEVSAVKRISNAIIGCLRNAKSPHMDDLAHYEICKEGRSVLSYMVNDILTGSPLVKRVLSGHTDSAIVELSSGSDSGSAEELVRLVNEKLSDRYGDGDARPPTVKLENVFGRGALCMCSASKYAGISAVDGTWVVRGWGGDMSVCSFIRSYFLEHVLRPLFSATATQRDLCWLVSLVKHRTLHLWNLLAAEAAAKIDCWSLCRWENKRYLSPCVSSTMYVKHSVEQYLCVADRTSLRRHCYVYDQFLNQMVKSLEKIFPQYKHREMIPLHSEIRDAAASASRVADIESKLMQMRRRGRKRRRLAGGR